MNPGDLSSAFLIGLLGTVHCFAMCGPIGGVLSFGLPSQQKIRYIAYYQIGRLISYALAGALSGLFGTGLFFSLSPKIGHFILLNLATGLMIAVGFYIGGWWPKWAYLERIGEPIWKKMEPLSRSLLPVRRIEQAFLYGLIWGWLPCGLVYSALLIALTQGQASQGALFMFFFGLGTLPATVSSGLLAHQWVDWAYLNPIKPLWRRLAGLSLILFALFSWWQTNRLEILPVQRANPFLF